MPDHPRGPACIRAPATWPSLALALGLGGLGLLFIAAPRLGAAIFGLPAPEGEALAYIPVVGLRDLAFAGYILGLLLRPDRGAVSVVLAATLLIPLGDIAVLLAVRGRAAGRHLLPHAGIDLRVAALVGMAAGFAGASRALLASVVFAFETTLQPLGLLPLLGGCSASFLVSALLMRNTIMTEKIVRRGVRVPAE